MRDAIWSTITRLRARSSGAWSKSARNWGSSPSGARAVSASASSATTIRWSARSLLLGPLHHIAVGDGLEDRALQARLVRDDQFGAVPGEGAGAVRLPGGTLGGEAEAADELAGGVLQTGLGDGRSVVAVRPPLLVEEAVEGLGEFGRVGVGGHVPAARDLEHRLPFGLGVEAVGVDVARVEAVLDIVHGVRHVVRPVHDLGLEGGAGAGASLRTQSNTGRSSS